MGESKTALNYSRQKAPPLTMAILCLWPFASFLNSNRDDALIYGAQIAAYGSVFLIASLIVLWVVSSWAGKKYIPAASHTIGAGCVCFFLYLPISNLLSKAGISLGTLRLLTWLLITICILIGAWKASRARGASLILLVVAAAMFVPPLTGLVHFASSGILKEGKVDNLPRVVGGPVALPNVYWLVFDAYPRGDILKDYFAVDNSGFVKSLERRGFRVSDRSTTNYISTKLSISTTVSMDYFLPEDEQLHPAMWTARLQGFNLVVEKFQSLGYQYVHAGSGGNNLKTRCGGMEDKCIRAEPMGSIGINEAEVGLLRLTPLFPILRRIAPGFLSFDFISIEDILDELDYSAEDPQFLFAHVLSPHPPQRFDQNCGRNVPVKFELDGDDYSDTVNAYLNDLRCLNPRIIGLIDEILMHDRSAPYILIQSDHGFRGRIGAAGIAKPDIAPHLVAFANFNAMKLPKVCAESVKDRFSLVNTFRIVLACIEGREAILLPDKYFVTSKGRLEEVYLE